MIHIVLRVVDLGIDRCGDIERRGVLDAFLIIIVELHPVIEIAVLLDSVGSCLAGIGISAHRQIDACEHSVASRLGGVHDGLATVGKIRNGSEEVGDHEVVELL